jgi:hypothetical protein
MTNLVGRVLAAVFAAVVVTVLTVLGSPTTTLVVTEGDGPGHTATTVP